MTDSIEDRCAAAHELGHAFGGREGGIAPDILTVSNGGGRCTWREARVLSSMSWAVAVMLGAGQAAERLYRIEQGIECPSNYGTCEDEQAYDELAAEAGEEDAWPAWASFAGAVQEAQVLLDAVWHELVPLVVPLAVNGRLDGIPA